MVLEQDQAVRHVGPHQDTREELVPDAFHAPRHAQGRHHDGEEERDRVGHRVGQPLDVPAGEDRLDEVAVQPDFRHRRVVERGRRQVLQQGIHRADEDDGVFELLEEFLRFLPHLRLGIGQVALVQEHVRHARARVEVRVLPAGEPVDLQQLLLAQGQLRLHRAVRTDEREGVIRPVQGGFVQPEVDQDQFHRQIVEGDIQVGRFGEERHPARDLVAAIVVVHVDESHRAPGGREQLQLR